MHSRALAQAGVHAFERGTFLAVTEAQRLVTTINELLPNTKSGSLRFFGEWFGGRRDNWHVITGATASGDELIIKFNEGETLTVKQPRGTRVDSETFEIQEATQVRWQWFYYGRAKTDENLYVLEYQRTVDGLTVRDTSDWFIPDHRPDASAVAVLID